MRDRFARITGSVRVRVALVAMVIVGSVLVLAAFGLTRVVEHRLEADLASRTDDAMARVAGLIEAGVTARQAFSSGGSPGGVVWILRSADGDVTVDTRNGGLVENFPRPEELESLIADLRANTDVPRLEIADAQVIQRSLDLADGRSVLFGVSSLDGVRASVATLSRTLKWGTPPIVLLVGMLAWMLAGRALRPVEQLRRTVESISHSTLDQRVEVPPTHDEIARLTTTMNTMLDRLQRSRDHERRFVADASHELRSPLASIRAQVETAIPPGEVGGGLLDEVNRLERLVNDLLELASSDEGRPVSHTPVPLDLVIAEEIALVQRASPVRITATVLEDVELVGRADSLGRLVRNLLDNAVRHASGNVEVNLQSHAGWATLTVDDDGPGVPEPDRERVFDRFARGDDSRARATGGIGLGLAVVQAVARQHGGDAECLEAPLGGARFLVRLPIATGARSAGG